MPSQRSQRAHHKYIPYSQPGHLHGPPYSSLPSNGENLAGHQAESDGIRATHSAWAAGNKSGCARPRLFGARRSGRLDGFENGIPDSPSRCPFAWTKSDADSSSPSPALPPVVPTPPRVVVSPPPAFVPPWLRVDDRPLFDPTTRRLPLPTWDFVPEVPISWTSPEPPCEQPGSFTSYTVEPPRSPPTASTPYRSSLFNQTTLVLPYPSPDFIPAELYGPKGLLPDVMPLPAPLLTYEEVYRKPWLSPPRSIEIYEATDHKVMAVLKYLAMC